MTAKPTRRHPWTTSVESIARTMASNWFPRGDLAQLRRMNIDSPSPVFWRLSAQRHLPMRPPSLARKWALIFQGIAVMTPTGRTGQSAHNKNIPVGKALFLGGDPDRTVGYCSEARLNRLLSARDGTLTSLLIRMFRMMATANQPFDWVQMAWLILHDGHNEQAADKVRRQIASAYHQTNNQKENPQ